MEPHVSYWAYLTPRAQPESKANMLPRVSSVSNPFAVILSGVTPGSLVQLTGGTDAGTAAGMNLCCASLDSN